MREGCTPGGMNLFRYCMRFAVSAAFVALAISASAAQLSGDARAALPRDMQQLVMVDYRAMQNSDSAMQLRDRVMPPDLKQFDDALRKSGINDNHDVDSLAFALYRVNGSADEIETVALPRAVRHRWAGCELPQAAREADLDSLEPDLSHGAKRAWCLASSTLPRWFSAAARR